MMSRPEDSHFHTRRHENLKCVVDEESLYNVIAAEDYSL
jgi:hypothetical protein